MKKVEEKISCLLFTFLSFLSFLHSDSVEILKTLTSIPAASGFEGPVRSYLRELWGEELGEENMRVDGMGNLIAKVNAGKSEAPNVLVTAHMDEVGLLVSEVTEEGFLKCILLGGWLDVALFCKEWIISTPKGEIRGFSGSESAHVAEKYPLTEAIPLSKLFIDVGACGKEEVFSMGIRPGMPITPSPSFHRVGARLVAKAMDDRAGLVVLDALVRQGISCDEVNLFVGATVQEELGMRGASVLSGSIKPDLVINIEVGMARDFPLLFSSGASTPKLGMGPTLFVFDGSMIPHQKLLNCVINYAECMEIPFQYEVCSIYGQDGAELQRSVEGVPVVNVGIPCRYPHSAHSMIDLNDLNATIDLVQGFVESLTPQKIEEIKRYD